MKMARKLKETTRPYVGWTFSVILRKKKPPLELFLTSGGREGGRELLLNLLEYGELRKK